MPTHAIKQQPKAITIPTTAQIFAIANQKGGVGKTTTAINLAASLAAFKHRVLLIDLDPQGNASTGSGIDKHALTLSSCDVLLGQSTIESALITTDYDYTILPTNADLTIAEVKLLDMENKEHCLRQALQTIIDHYDYILIDCAPSLNMLTINGLVAAHDIIIPMQCEYYALEGLSDLMSTIHQLQQSTNLDLKIAGILRTLYDPRNRLTKDVSAELKQHFGEKLLHNVIPRNIRLAEAPSYGKPILHYDKRSSGAEAYLALASEISKIRVD